MELSLLKDRIIANFKGNSQELELILDLVENDNGIYPFNEYELLICSLMKQGSLTYEKYLEIRSEYISQNPYLWLFEISAPRDFGENFAQTYLMGKCPLLKKASKKLDKNFSGEYDLWLEGI
ncbi:MAG: hypothetical protein NZ516_13170, partial [Raineya sp.]|nr:hypothetical protein [Raineya sp.]